MSTGLTNTHTARGFSDLYHVFAPKQCIFCPALRRGCLTLLYVTSIRGFSDLYHVFARKQCILCPALRHGCLTLLYVIYPGLSFLSQASQKQRNCDVDWGTKIKKHMKHARRKIVHGWHCDSQSTSWSELPPADHFEDRSEVMGWFLALTCPTELKDVGFKLTKFEFLGDRLLPGYRNFNLTLSVMREQAKVRGPFVGYVGGPMIDIIVKMAFSHKIIEYVLFEAEKEVIK